MSLSYKRKQAYLITGAIILISFFVALALAYGEPNLAELNKRLGSNLYNFLGAGFIPLFTVITYIGSAYISYPITVVLIVYLLVRKNYWIAALLAYNLIGVRLINRLLKSIFEVARPELEPLVHASYYSFPSGHSMNSIAFFGLLAFLFSRYISRSRAQSVRIWRTVAILIFLIGLSRVYLGVHFPLDVLGGFAAGGAWLLLSIYIHSFLPIREQSTHKKRHMGEES
ncbi:phosphatase PAP2 family protein [Virgibacillus necropolis]|uniref:phosphatase PAP2 family protein n=1 Tax=Virgibacillus necropolis TaxID=163877 RepID=UPI00384B0148